MASKWGKFELTFVFWEFVVTTTNFFAKTRSKLDDGCELFPAEFRGVTLARYGHAHEGTNGRFRTRSPTRSLVARACEPRVHSTSRLEQGEKHEKRLGERRKRPLSTPPPFVRSAISLAFATI